MIETWKQSDIEPAIAAMVRRGATDAEFRKLALSDPQKAVVLETGKELPPGLKLKFVDGDSADAVIILPPVSTEPSELSDAQLEQVAGGGRCAGSCVGSCAVTSTVSIGLPDVGAIGGCI
jgi:hypothetical protein